VFFQNRVFLTGYPSGRALYLCFGSYALPKVRWILKRATEQRYEIFKVVIYASITSRIRVLQLSNKRGYSCSSSKTILSVNCRLCSDTEWVFDSLLLPITKEAPSTLCNIPLTQGRVLLLGDFDAWSLPSHEAVGSVLPLLPLFYTPVTKRSLLSDIREGGITERVYSTYYLPALLWLLTSGLLTFLFKVGCPVPYCPTCLL